MHKISRIHIGKVPYDIEQDAEVSLTQYMAALRGALGADAAKDTMADMELHITEILDSRGISQGGVITADDVQAIKEQLGDPAQLKSSTEDTKAPKSGGKRAAWFGVLGVVVLLLGVSAFLWRDRLFPGQIMDKTEQQTYQRPITNLKMNVESGDVTVRAGQDGQVSVERHFKWSGAAPTFAEEWNGEQLNITTDCPDNQRNCSLGYVVYLPSTVVADIHTNAGNIDIEGMTGELRLATSAGNVDISGAQGKVWSRVNDGNISMFGQSAETDLQTDSGNIDVRFSAAPTQVKAKTAAGNIDIVVPFGDTYAVRADTSSGQRTVSVQQESTAVRHIDAQASVGNVTVRHPQN